MPEEAGAQSHVPILELQMHVPLGFDLGSFEDSNLKAFRNHCEMLF